MASNYERKAEQLLIYTDSVTIGEQVQVLSNLAIASAIEDLANAVRELKQDFISIEVLK